LSPGGLPGRLVTAGAGTVLSLGVIRAVGPGRSLPGPGLGSGRPGLRAGRRIVLLLPRRSQLLLRGPCLLLCGGRRLPGLGQLRLGLPRGLPRLPPFSLGLLGAGLKPGPLGRRELCFQPGPLLGLVPLGVRPGLRYLLLRGLAHLVQLRL